jgi:hypothetical protein
VDHYPTHLTPESENETARLEIRLIKIPKRATEIWQPLDQRICGTCKVGMS